MGHKQRLWKNFVYSNPTYCAGMLSCRTVEGQGFFVDREWNPSTSQTPPTTLIYMSTHGKCTFVSANTVPDTACFCLMLTLESTVGWISTLPYEMSTNCWQDRFSVPCCTHIVRTKLMHRNWRYTKKKKNQCLQLQMGPNTCLLYCWDTLYCLLGSTAPVSKHNIYWTQKTTPIFTPTWAKKNSVHVLL